MIILARSCISSKYYLIVICLIVLSGCSILYYEDEDEDEDEYSKLNQLPSYCTKSTNNTCSISACFPGEFASVPGERSAKTSAYRQFNALNWPLKEGVTGMPDYDQNNNDLHDSYPVWQSWPNVKQLIDHTNLSWEDAGSLPNLNSLPEQCGELFNIKEGAVKSEYDLFIELKKYKSVPRGNKIEVLTEWENPQGEILLDTQEELVRYQTYLNKPAFDYLKTRPVGGFNELLFPVGKGIESANAFRRGAIFIKAAWKILTNEELEYYHKAFALITGDDGKSCELKVVGVSALHIVSKNNPKGEGESDKVNEWSWATYESIYNSPQFSRNKNNDWILNKEDVRAKEEKFGWGFFDVNLDVLKETCIKDFKWDETLESCSINKPITCDETCNKSNMVSYPSVDYEGYIESCSDEMGETVWKNYKMIGNQWRGRTGKFSPPELRNNVLEPFEDMNDSSCADCHSEANEEGAFKDFIYLSKYWNKH